MGKRLLTVNEKILLLLSAREKLSEQAPTQKQMALELHLRRSHVSRGLSELIAEGYLEESRSHVRGELRLMKTYELAAKGAKLASEVSERLRDAEVKVKEGGRTRTMTLEKVGGSWVHRLGHLGIALEVEARGHVDLDRKAGDESQRKKGFISLLHGIRESDRFLGRVQELKELRGLVETADKRMVLVLGPKGIGKTALCARLAKDLEPRMNVFWFTGSDAEGSGDLLWNLSEYLERLGKYSLRTQYQDAEEVDEGEALAILGENLEGTNSVLVFDGLSEMNEGLALMTKRIIFSLAGTKGIKILATARKRNALAGFEDHFQVAQVEELDLKGLDRESARELLSGKITGKEFEGIFKLAEGNPLYLQLAGAQKLDVKKDDFEPGELALLRYLKVAKEK